MTMNSPRVAYLCMEFAVRQDMQLYSGGLGILAGDILKAAADAGIPFVGIGLFWTEGYVTQCVREDGALRHEWHQVSRDALEPIDVDVSVGIEGRDVPLRAWRLAGEGHAPLLLLEPREEHDRWLTRRLYQGRQGDRVMQEIVLGVGGVRLLRALGMDVDVIHLNEGHAVFAALELAREKMEGGMTFADAIAAGRERIVFTTHTPVVAGNEQHPLDFMIEKGADLSVLSRENLASLGGDPFDMTVAALRVSVRANAVAQLHAKTAQRMWAHVEGRAPITDITNGVHVPTWQDARMAAAFSGGDPWDAHRRLKSELLAAVRERARVEMAPDGLVMGFARRATTYKRPGLVFREIDRIAPLLESGRLQLVFAGKSYPDDPGGQDIVVALIEMTRRFPGSVVFLPDYDMEIGRLMTRGCDAWLNNPLRPSEASGTSGMKAALNGVLNVSILDGWWAEACDHSVNGWQFGDGLEGDDADARDLDALLALLEGDVLPTFYENRAKWVAMMRAAEEMARTRFSAERMLRDYGERLYRGAS